MIYFELIQSVSRVKLDKTPATFIETSNKKYNLILEEINNTLEDFFLNDAHNFRRKSSTFNTVVNQQTYTNVDGLILKDGFLIKNDDLSKSKLLYSHDYEQFLLNSTSSTGKPQYYTIFNDKIWLLDIPDKIYEITVLYDTDSWAKTTLGVEKKVLELETDEPNFPEKYHTILKYGALMRLYYNNNEKLAKYTQLYNNKLKQISTESRGTREATSTIKFTETNW